MSTKKKEKDSSKEGLSPREMRLKLAETISAKQKEPKEDEIREEFKKYFTKLKRKMGLGSDLEQIIWLHFKAYGFDKKEKFDDGIRHFGYSINE